MGVHARMLPSVCLAKEKGEKGGPEHTPTHPHAVLTVCAHTHTHMVADFHGNEKQGSEIAGNCRQLLFHWQLPAICLLQRALGSSGCALENAFMPQGWLGGMGVELRFPGNVNSQDFQSSSHIPCTLAIPLVLPLTLTPTNLGQHVSCDT